MQELAVHLGIPRPEDAGFEEAVPFAHQCLVCETQVDEYSSGWEPSQEYERKGLMECPECGYMSMVHFYYESEKNLHVEGEDSTTDMKTVYVYTGKSRIKNVLHNGKITVTANFERGSFTDPDETVDVDGNDMDVDDLVRPIEDAVEQAGMINHMDLSLAGITQDEEEVEEA